jgi:hypothetical protein
MIPRLDISHKYRSKFFLKNIKTVLKILSGFKLLSIKNSYYFSYKRSPVYFPENFKSLSSLIFSAIKDKKNVLKFNTFFLSYFFSFFWLHFFNRNSFFKPIGLKKEFLLKKYFYFYFFFNFCRSITVYYNFFKFFSLGLSKRLLSYKKQNKRLTFFFKKAKTFKNKKLNLKIKAFIFKFNFLFLKVLTEILSMIKLF